MLGPGLLGALAAGLIARRRRHQNQQINDGIQQPPPGAPTSIQLPLTPPSGEDVTGSLWFTQPFVDQSSLGESDIVASTLREAQKLGEESAARSGVSGGLGSRLITETLMTEAPQLWQQAQATDIQGANAAMNELALQNQLFGNVGGQPTWTTVQNMEQLAFGEAGLTGSYNPAFTYGLFPITQEQVQNMQHRQRVNDWINWLMNMGILLRGLGIIPGA